MRKIRVTDLESIQSRKPIGYLADVLSRGTVTDGILTLEDGAYTQLQSKYSPKPTLAKQLSNVAGAATRVIKAKAQGQVVTVPDEERDRRMAICQVCEFFTGNRCLKCGCVAIWKAKLATEKCPVGKW